MLTFLYVTLSLVLDEGSVELRYFPDVSENLISSSTCLGR
jgi:hypothetical protein